jgi:Predicted membrane protein
MHRSFKMAIVCLFALMFSGVAISADVLTMEQAQEIALEQSGGGQVTGIQKRNHGRGDFFRVEIDGDDGICFVEIDADTGRLLQLVRRPDRGRHAGRRRSQSTAGATDGISMSFEQLHAIALERSGGGIVVECDLDRKRGGDMVYEFEIFNEDTRYEVELGADTGEVLQFEQKNRRNYMMRQLGDVRMTAVEAVYDGLERVGGGLVTGYELERRGAGWLHEIDIRFEGRRHEVTIDDTTGSVIEYHVR